MDGVIFRIRDNHIVIAEEGSTIQGIHIRNWIPVASLKQLNTKIHFAIKNAPKQIRADKDVYLAANVRSNLSKPSKGGNTENFSYGTRHY